MPNAFSSLPTAACLATLLALTGCASVPQGPSLGSMLDKGAVKASKAEVLKFQQVGGAPLNVVSPAGAKVSMLYREDGTFDGTIQFGSNTSRSTGKWTLDDNARFCMDEKLVDWNRQVFKCYFYYKLDNQILTIQSMTEDRSAPTTSYPMPK